MEPPYVVKPVNEGSSVGVFIIRKGDNRPPAALGSDDWNCPNEMMVEEFVPGRELTVSVMGDRALGVTEITTELEFYDYEAKYAPAARATSLPARFPSRQLRKHGAGGQGAPGAGLPGRHAHRFPL